MTDSVSWTSSDISSDSPGGVFAGVSLAADVLFDLSVSAEECVSVLVLLMCTLGRRDSSAQHKWECYPCYVLRDRLAALPARRPGRLLYCLGTVGRWIVPELMSLAKGGSENMHTCCSRSNETPTGWYRREDIWDSRGYLIIFECFSFLQKTSIDNEMLDQVFEKTDVVRSSRMCCSISMQAVLFFLLKVHSTSFTHEDLFTHHAKELLSLRNVFRAFAERHEKITLGI